MEKVGKGALEVLLLLKREMYMLKEYRNASGIKKILRGKNFHRNSENA